MIWLFGLVYNYSISGFAPDVVCDLRKMLNILFTEYLLPCALTYDYVSTVKLFRNYYLSGEKK